ncbi:MAG: patatin-like phospholipase family protein [Gemmatimonadetes bacterium]|nr:patatin-like phospholipase family protein [Gemmatimonadota bacterium]
MKGKGPERGLPARAPEPPGSVGEASPGGGGGTWLVLGGGGLKGLAHVGVWEALGDAGVEVDGIVGTSIGALVAALAASGMPVNEMRAHALALDRARVARVNRRAVWINGIRQPSLFHGETLRSLYASILPRKGWGALRIPVLMNAVDLADASTVWFGAGARTDLSLTEAVYASSALPVFYPPQEARGHAYVDGGIADTLPIGKAADQGAGRIIAVDVGSGGKADVREVLRGGMIAVHQRVVAMMMAERRHAMVADWPDTRLTYVRPQLAGYGTFDFEHIPYFLDEGRRAMREALVAS